VLVVAFVAIPVASAADRKPPRIVGAQMLDADKDGKADRVRLTYSERIRHALDKKRFPFTVVGYKVKRVTKAKGKTLVILLAEKAVSDPTAAPAVRYKRTTQQPVRDRAGNQARRQTFRGTKSFGVPAAGVGGPVIYVSTSGNDANPGTQAFPKRTVQAGVATAAAMGAVVHVAGGTYDEGGGLQLADDVDIYGGFDAGSWTRGPGIVTTITGSPQGVLADGDTGVTLQSLTIRGSNTGASAYGVLAANSSNLILEQVTIEAGPGAPGTDGVPFIEPAASGTEGDEGVDGFEDDSYWYCAGNQVDPPLFTDAGTNPADATASGGRGRRGAITNGGNVAGGAGEPSPGGANGGVPASGNVGGAGDDGGDGANGAVGSRGGAGHSPSGYAPTPGSTGGAGIRGVGGGGGAGGGSTHSTGTCNDWGGSGGGGGAGGRGGAGGQGGTPGGGSFAIYIWASTVRVVDAVLKTGNGGGGGAGGPGQPGGNGALGGVGGSGYDEGRAGGGGGDGGDGGDGGQGGGGAGGPSVGILRVGGVADVATTTFQIGAGGPGGAPNGLNGESAQISAPD